MERLYICKESFDNSGNMSWLTKLLEILLHPPQPSQLSVFARQSWIPSEETYSLTNNISQALHSMPLGAIPCQPYWPNFTKSNLLNCWELHRNGWRELFNIEPVKSCKIGKSDFTGTIFNNFIKDAFHNLVIDYRTLKYSKTWQVSCSC